MGDFQTKSNKNTKKIFQYVHVLGKCSFTRHVVKVNNS